MYKIFSYKLIALFMAFLMFSTSVVFSMDIHFCENKLESINFFGEAEACEMMQEKQQSSEVHSCCEAPKKEIKSCHDNEEANGSCCHNESISLSNGDFESSTFAVVKFQQIVIAVIVLFPHINFFRPEEKQLDYAIYNPPPLIKDITIHLQVFRI